MPTTIAIEAHNVEVLGVETPFQHLYLVKTVTDDKGNVIDEKVIRGTAGQDLTLTIQANLDIEASSDARGSETPAERHHTPLDLDGRNANDVWNLMVQHAVNIENANLPYGFDVLQEVYGPDVNSNTVVASALHTVGINLSQTLPFGIQPKDIPLYDQVNSMTVNDVLNGGARADLVYGGAGNDYIYGERQDDHLLGQVGNDTLAGSAGADRIAGGAGDDRLLGGAGNDVLNGGGGKDVFVFSTRLNGVTNVDTIRDFSVVNDTLWLDNRDFSNVGPNGALKASAFWTGTLAHDANDRIIYDTENGALYYDPDGTGAASQVQFAKVATGLKMTFKDFFVI